jgi:hypothetical protein
MCIIASSPSWNLGNGIRNTFGATITIVGGTCSTVVVNWENKLVCCITNVGLSYHSDCCSIASNNGFLIILIIYGATLLSSYEIDSSSTLIWNKFVHRFLVGMKNPCIDCKDCAPILVGFFKCG